MDNTAYFVSQDETGNLAVSKFNGYAVTPVSTEAIEDILDQAAAAGNISNAFAFSYGRNGHLFYVLQLPSLNRTMVYDTVSTLWHERTSQIAPLYDTSGRWLANCYTFFNGQHYIGDYQSGNIYRLSNTAYTDNGQPIIRERTTSILSNPDGLRMFISRFQIDADVGEGLPTGQGSVPTIRIQISKNGGRTFDSVVEIPMGQIGQYLTRVKVNRVGYGRSFVFRITFSDPCFCSIFNGIIDSEAGDS